MARSRWLLALLVFCPTFAGLCRAADYTYYLTGNAGEVRPKQTEGALLPMGRGRDGDSVETLLFHQRTASEDPRVLEIIRSAEGIWLAGGDQARYVNLWKGTSVASALNAHVRAGKPLGGTSAGLAVLGEFPFSATEPGTLTSEIALKDPFDTRITLERDFLHFELLRDIITDSHFMPRVIALGPTSRFDLRQLDIQNPAATAMIAVVDGKLSPLP